MKRILYIAALLQLSLIGCTTAQEKVITVKVLDSDSSLLQGATIKVVTTEGGEKELETNDKGEVVLNLSCSIGYFITCDYSGYHKEKMKIMKPCEENVKSDYTLEMKSNRIVH